jgi:hypothetical protein
MSLWCESWHQVPASSLPDNEKILARLAMCDKQEWAQIRDRVMAEWRLCADGRWYHPYVAEKAKEAWERKRHGRDRVRAANEQRSRIAEARAEQDRKTSERRRENRLKKQKAAPASRNDNVTTSMIISNDVVTGLTGTGTGTGKKEKDNPPRAVRDQVATPPLLELAASLPAWLSASDWQAWLAYRKKIKRPLDAEAERRTMAKLDELRKQGHDPGKVIDQSIVNGWQGLFAMKEGASGANMGAATASAAPDPTRGYR